MCIESTCMSGEKQNFVLLGAEGPPAPAEAVADEVGDVVDPPGDEEEAPPPAPPPGVPGFVVVALVEGVLGADALGIHKEKCVIDIIYLSKHRGATDLVYPGKPKDIFQENA